MAHGSHGHAHHAHHASGHENPEQHSRRRLTLGLVLVAGFAVVELIGGVLTHSLALLADAGHMVTDVLSLTLALAASAASGQAADSRRTYGYRRYQVLAAFTNGLFLVLLSVWILFEAATRLTQPKVVAGGPMLVIAVAGLLVNLAAYFVMHGSHDNLNVRAAAAHVLGDLLGSVAAIAAAILILGFGWDLADPLLSALVAVILIVMGVRLLRDTGHVLLEGSPTHLDFTHLQRELLEAVPRLEGVHHVHAWSLTPQQPVMTLHAVVGEAADGDQVIRSIAAFLKARHGVAHVTVQIERASCNQDCA